MYLKGMLENDIKFQTVLENMQFQACTKANITLLNTHVFCYSKTAPDIAASGFQQVPIIIAHNAHQDTINSLAVENFAKQTHQTLE